MCLAGPPSRGTGLDCALPSDAAVEEPAAGRWTWPLGLGGGTPASDGFSTHYTTSSEFKFAFYLEFELWTF